MATAYFYRAADRVHGPVSFRELVRLVRDATIAAEDPVRADWEAEFHPAANVVGLFHMAGRQEILEAWEREQAAANASLLTPLPMAPEAETAETATCSACECTAKAVTGVDSNDEAATIPDHNDQMAATISAALSEAERQRFPAVSAGWWPWVPTRVNSPATIRGLFRWGMTLGAACLVAWGISNWSANELRRFPDPAQIAAGISVFPLWGACARTEYQLLLADTVILAGLLGYCGASLLEGLAED